MRLVIEDGKIEFNGEPIIEHINFNVNDNSKIALIGKNGCGKTSLLKVIEGELNLVFDNSNSGGSIIRSNDFSLGYLKQISFSNEELTLEQSILECYKKIIDIEKQLEEITKIMENDTSDKIINEYSRLSELYENNDGYYYKKEYNTVLKKFGFNNDSFSKKLKEFSGGEKSKIAFVKLLLSKPDLLLLDEPTNHLDLDAIEWLEEYLSNYKKAFVVVSHDREFINKVAKEVYEIEYNTIIRYSGNYNEYLIQKESNYNSRLKQFNQQQKEIKHQQELIDRFRYKATKAKMVQSRIKQLDKLEIITEPKKDDKKTFKMNIDPISESGRDVITIKQLSIGYDKCLANINLNITKGEKIGIVGDNGSGKSTFLKTIMGYISPLSGEYRYGFNVKTGYFDQQIATKVSSKSVLEDYIDTYPGLDNYQARKDLGAFLFSGDDVNKTLSVLSGGEVVRLGLCKLFKKRPNLLILDEPTNHMDIYSKEKIEKMLKDYKGTIIFVSHDRYFVRKIADSVLSFDNGEAIFYPNGYSQYEEKSNDREYKKENNVSVVKIKRDNIDKGNLKKELSKLEKEIQEHEERIESINEKFEDDEVYSDFMLTRELEEELEEIEDNLQILMRKWEELMEGMENK